jgi:solute:Na+ symporter, SSS family
MILFSIYIFGLIVSIWLLNKQEGSKFFTSKKNISWLFSGLSLFMLSLSVDQGQFLTGIIANKGMTGLWIIWVGWIGAFIIPLVFAPYWKKLDFISDNQFLLYRFPGRGGKILHIFRALYVGVLVVALSICFHMIGFSRVISYYFDVSVEGAILLCGGVLALYTLKNVFDIKLKLDAFHAGIYLLSFVVILFFLWNESRGITGITEYFNINPEKKAIFPTEENQSAWFSIAVILGIQWWSCNLFDGGGPEMSRYTAVKDSRSARLTGLLPIVMSFVLGNLLLLSVLLVLGSSHKGQINELTYIETIFNVVPDYLSPLVIAGIFGVFITTAESLLIWGSSFLTVDVFKGYITPDSSEKQMKWMSTISMLLLIILSTLFTLLADNLYDLILFTFSIAAGVAPIYILRWSCFKINAWSQLSAMLSSGFFTLYYPYLHSDLPFKNYPMQESRILVVTVLTTCVWLLVTFVTPAPTLYVKERFTSLIGSFKAHYNGLAIALIYGIAVLITTVSITWLFLFFMIR